jgi:hypothetical protein
VSAGRGVIVGFRATRSEECSEQGAGRNELHGRPF